MPVIRTNVGKVNTLQSVIAFGSLSTEIYSIVCPAPAYMYVNLLT